jgi:hypothetical protein
MGRPILLQVFQGIAERHSMVLQEGMHPETGPIAQQTPELFLIEFPGLVPGQRKAFEDMARHVLLFRVQTGHHIIREMNGNFHEYTLCFHSAISFQP